MLRVTERKKLAAREGGGKKGRVKEKKGYKSTRKKKFSLDWKDLKSKIIILTLKKKKTLLFVFSNHLRNSNIHKFFFFLW